MKVQSSIKCSFGIPEHGWLPVSLIVGEESLEFEASDVPSNPLEQLLDGLWGVVQGREAEVWFHLEPSGYYLTFSPKEYEIEISVSYSHSSTPSESKPIAHVQAVQSEALLPFWRALRSIQTKEIVEPHWPSTNFGNMQNLKSAINHAVET